MIGSNYLFLPWLNNLQWTFGEILKSWYFYNIRKGWDTVNNYFLEYEATDGNQLVFISTLYEKRLKLDEKICDYQEKKFWLLLISKFDT